MLNILVEVNSSPTIFFFKGIEIPYWQHNWKTRHAACLPDRYQCPIRGTGPPQAWRCRGQISSCFI